MATKKTETKPQLQPQKGRKPFTDEDASDKARSEKDEQPGSI